MISPLDGFHQFVAVTKTGYKDSCMYPLRNHSLNHSHRYIFIYSMYDPFGAYHWYPVGTYMKALGLFKHKGSWPYIKQDRRKILLGFLAKNIEPE